MDIKKSLTPVDISQSMKAKAQAAATPFLKTLAAGLLGALVGKGLGRPSLLTGIAVTFAGHMHGAHKAAEKAQSGGNGNVYDGDSPVIAFGVGMMAGGAVSGGLNGTGSLGFVEGVKERLSEFKDDLYNRLYADKFSSAKPASPSASASAGEGTSGIGEITFTGKQYEGGDVVFNESELDKIERQLQQGAVDYQRGATAAPKSNVSGFAGDIGELLESRIF